VQLTDSELAPEFKKAADDFVTFVKTHARSKVVKGSEISGPAFAAMMENFLVSACNCFHSSLILIQIKLECLAKEF
jgi:hypothetical protein